MVLIFLGKLVSVLGWYHFHHENGYQKVLSPKNQLKLVSVIATLKLTLFYQCHNNKKNKTNKKKNLHQNLSEGIKYQVWNFAHGLKLMEEDL